MASWAAGTGPWLEWRGKGDEEGTTVSVLCGGRGQSRIEFPSVVLVSMISLESDSFTRLPSQT